ncbi:MAG: tetratricopeptide repeat protein [Haliscomenobacter sp.]|nr:tetratricopeptide repeat protein [Haliscomenobacter sp.]
MKQVPLAMLLWFCTATLVFAQHNPLATEYYQTGESALLQKDYKKALRRFQQAAALQPDLMAAERGIGLCYELLKDYPAALTHYLKIVETAPKFSPRPLLPDWGNLFQAWSVQQSRCLFRPVPANAAHGGYFLYRQWGKGTRSGRPVSGKAGRNIRACQISMDTSKFNQNVRIANLGSGINSRSDDYFPFLSNNQELLFFTRRRNMESDENLFSARLRTGTGMRPAP